MSATPAKHLYSIIGIYKAPPGLSRNEFNGHIQELGDALARLPVAKNLLDFNVIFQTDDLEEHMQDLGFPSPPATALANGASENRDNMVAFFRDPAVVQLIHGSEHFGLQAGACAFTADLAVHVDKASSTDANSAKRPHGILIFKIPGDISEEDYHSGIDSMIEALLSTEVAKKHLIKHSKWIQNDDFTDELARWKYPEAERVVVLMLECDTTESLKEILGHEHIKQVISEAKENLNLHVDSNCFSAEVASLI
ncbi:hypothetical protein R3P38DRAFT_3390085 [Favolaschia claudopus]|uniref:EthD domain-containing protein n=1 Tax=Favolaschia claudopus TaxID=2862362 RepID=A0AAW0CQZ6_9AGAR